MIDAALMQKLCLLFLPTIFLIQTEARVNKLYNY